jgi:type II secretory pathway pseudopilin PulG
MVTVTGMRREEGYTLVELLVAMILMLIVMGATLTTFSSGQRRQRVNERQIDSVELARSTLARMSKQLRNLASPTNAAIKTIDVAQDNDLVFQTYEPAKRRVRYCLNTTSHQLFQMTQTADPTAGNLPATATCAAVTTGWNKVVIVANNVVNQRAQSVPVFQYNAPTTDTAKITTITATVFVDVNAANKRPDQLKVATGLGLRNQNQNPTSGFSVRGLGGRRFLLDAAASADPEGRTLTYIWYRGSTAGFTPLAANEIGRGVVLDYTFAASDAVGAWYFKLEVRDPGGLSAFCPTNGTGISTGCSGTGPI